jgi:DNA-binding LytR/AlgR family response regulator
VRVLVVDDEPLARARLLRILERIVGVTCVGEAASGAAALAQMATLLPDVVLLDIQMPGLDGLALAATPGIPPIIFTTAHVQFAANAFDLDAVDFLTKPVRQDRLERAFDRVRRRVSAATTAPARRIAVHDAGTVRFVDPAQVVAFRARDKYVDFTLDGEELLVRESLDALETRLQGAGFVRVHRAALVRCDAIRALAQEGDALVAWLADGTKVNVSRRHAPNLRRLVGLRR